MAHYVIYLPGVGDHTNAPFQIKALERWHKLGLEPSLQAIGWSNNVSYEAKLNRILKAVDDLASHHLVSLVGASAGASMAVNVYAVRRAKIHKVALICGKVNNPQTLGDNYKNKYPALLGSVTASNKNAKKLSAADKKKMLTVVPIFDGTVLRSDSIIPGVKNRTIPFILHGISIGAAITIFKRHIINFLKAKAVQ